MKDTAFQQLLKPLTKELIEESVRRYRSDYGYEKFKTWDHLKVMIYAHLQEIKSLRLLEIAANSQKLGESIEVHRTTLSDANYKRNPMCFMWIAEQLMSLMPRKLRSTLKKVIKILDSSPIQLKGKGYNEWAKHYATSRCQGLKLHVEYDLHLESPTGLALSYANYNDVNMGRNWPILSDVVYVFDKGYYDYNWWWSIHQKKAFFVTRLKKNSAIVLGDAQAITAENILEDNLFKLKNKNPRGGKKNLYTENLRRIRVAREGKSPLVLVTNFLDLPAEEVAILYKNRWEIELFFKWVKQNLKLKKFFGKSENAVKIQLITAIIAYLLVWIFKNVSKDKRTLRHVLTWLKYNLHVLKYDNREQGPPPDYPWIRRTGGVLFDY